MTNKERFLSLVTGSEEESFLKKLDYSIKNRYWLRESHKIAIKILIRLDELKWNYEQFAVAMELTNKQTNNILKGNQNLKLNTLVKIQQVLNISILTSYEENILQ